MSVRGQTIEWVEKAIVAELERQAVDVAIDTRALTHAALRSLVEEYGRFALPVELIALGGAEPGSVQSMFDATIGDLLRHAGVAVPRYKGRRK